MNPLVTIVNLAVGKFEWGRSLVYMAAQTLGAVAGYGLLLVSTEYHIES